LGAKLLLLLASVGVAAVLAEAGLQLFGGKGPHSAADVNNLMYRYDETLGWFPVPGSSMRLHPPGGEEFDVVNNSEGFRGPERETGSAGKPGIMFLGDSFVWGYDVGAAERFTEKLQARHPEWSVYNLGVSGYGTDQEYLLLRQKIDEYKPRVVFVVFCTENDDDDNRLNIRYGGYYKPYCVTVGEDVQFRGVPVPKSERVLLADHPLLSRSALVRLATRGYVRLKSPAVQQHAAPTGAIIREMQKYANSKGALLAIGLTSPDSRLEELLRTFEIPYVNLSTKLRFRNFGFHWTPEGHTFVCDKLDELLTAGKFMEPVKTPDEPGRPDVVP
jgi:hypothetical protein